METTIIKKLSPNKMMELFNSPEKLNIRFYEPVSGCNINKSEFDIPINYRIKIRHSEGEDVKCLLNDALSEIKNISRALILWNLLGDVHVNEEDELDEDFVNEEGSVLFPKGTDKIEVWNWFEEEFDLSVAKDLMKF